MSTPDTCIIANADISGIGVRIAVYIQAFLTFAPALVFTWDHEVDLEEEKMLYSIYLPLALNAVALLVTTAIQQNTVAGLGLFHILIVLRLIWMMTASALVICIIPSLDSTQNIQLQHSIDQECVRMEELSRSSSFVSSKYTTSNTSSVIKSGLHLTKAAVSSGICAVARALWSVLQCPKRLRPLAGAGIISLLLTGMSVLGIWAWYKHPHAGDSSECLSVIQDVFMLRNFDLTNSRIRAMSLSFHFITLIPAVNVLLLISIARLFSFLATWLLCCLPHVNRDRIQFIVAYLVPVLLTIRACVDTEVMLRRNAAFMDDSSEIQDWSFGQILAMLLAGLPVFTAAKMILKSLGAGKSLHAKWISILWHARKVLRGSNVQTLVLDAFQDIMLAQREVQHAIANPGSGNLPEVRQAALLSVSAQLHVAHNALWNLLVIYDESRPVWEDSRKARGILGVWAPQPKASMDDKSLNLPYISYAGTTHSWSDLESGRYCESAGSYHIHLENARHRIDLTRVLQMPDVATQSVFIQMRALLEICSTALNAAHDAWHAAETSGAFSKSQ